MVALAFGVRRIGGGGPPGIRSLVEEPAPGGSGSDRRFSTRQGADVVGALMIFTYLGVGVPVAAGGADAGPPGVVGMPPGAGMPPGVAWTPTGPAGGTP